VPWQYIYQVSRLHDISAPGLMAALLPAWLGVVILLSVVIAILKVLPAVMLGNSRTLYAFSADGILPPAFSRVHPTFRTPHLALLLTAFAASLCVVGCNLAGDFFLGVDLLVLSMLVNFIFMALALVMFPRVNPGLYQGMTFLRSRSAQLLVAIAAILLLGGLVVIEVAEDLVSAAPWYLKSTTSWLVVMAGACMLFWKFWTRLRKEGLDPNTDVFKKLPVE